MKDKVSSYAKESVPGKTPQACQYCFVLLAFKLKFDPSHLWRVKSRLRDLRKWFHSVSIFISIIFLDKFFLSSFTLSPMSSSRFGKLLSRMCVFAKHILRSVSGDGDLTCKKAALSEVGNAAAWPKPSTAAGMARRQSPGCRELCMLPFTNVIQSQPFHSASSPSLKTIYPHSCFSHGVYILHFQNH